MQLFLSPDFHIKTLRKKPKTAFEKANEWRQKLLDHQLTHIGRALSSYIPQSLFDQHTNKAKTRRRIFSYENTFWGFFLQSLQSDSSCQSIVHQFRIIAQQHQKKTISSSTSAYCQARQRLPEALINDIFDHSHQRGNTLHPLVNRRVVCADGTGLTAADTSENKAHWPQLATQQPGCGFPQLRLCALFNLHTGVALSYRIGNKRSHELPLLREQENSFQKNDIFIGDKGFICFYDQARLLQQNVDSIVALSKRKPLSSQQADAILGEDDLLITIPKFTSTIAQNRYPKARWDNLPPSLQMRQIKVVITTPGYRTKSVYLLTTLLNEKRYPASVIAELYRQRWRVELFFRDLKTTLGMDTLHSKTPAMVSKEIKMFFIAYNTIRLLIIDSLTEMEPTDFAFKSCVQTLLAYQQQEHYHSKNRLFLLQRLWSYITHCTLFKRPGRVEPRVVKRRPKPFKLMTKPRQQLRNQLLAKIP